MPKASCSRSNQAPPMPSTARPPETWSRVVASLAVSPGLRNVLAPTISPSRTREVSGAERRRGRSSPRRSAAPTARRSPCRWSHVQTESQPAVLGGEGRVAEARPVGLLRPELEPETGHPSSSSWMVVAPNRKVIRSWRSNRSRIRRSASSGSSCVVAAGHRRDVGLRGRPSRWSSGPCRSARPSGTGRPHR